MEKETKENIENVEKNSVEEIKKNKNFVTAMHHSVDGRRSDVFKARRTSSRIDSCYRHGAQREADYVPCTGRIASSVCKKTWREDSAKGNSAFVSCDSG